MSVQRDEVKKWAEAYDEAQYRAAVAKPGQYKGRFNCLVMAHHEEGTHYVFQSAYAVERGEYLIIFPEHHDIVVLHKEELTFWAQYKRVKIKREPLTAATSVE